MNIKIADRTLLQKNSTLSFKEKIEIARQLENLGVSAIEIDEIENVKIDTLLIKTIAYFAKNTILSISGGSSKKSIDNAADALATAVNPRIRIELPVSVVGMEYTCHKKPDKMLGTIEELVSYAKTKCADVELVMIDATRGELEFIKSAITAAKNSGANLITICDNAAEMMPDEFGAFVKDLGVDGIVCDNKNGLAAANALMAVKNGANTVKTSVSNEVSLEVFAGIIKNCGNNFAVSSDIKYTQLNRIIKQIERIIGGNQGEKVTAFAGDLFENELSFDQNDDKQTILDAIVKLGFDLSDEDNNKVYEEFLRASQNRKVTVKELDAIVATVALQVPPKYKLVNFVVNSGNIITSSAQITLEDDGKAKQGISTGDGPIDAAFHAIEQIIGVRYELEDFQIQSVTEGKGAMGNAIVKLRVNGKLYSGSGISTDIIAAAIKAYINAVNKIVYEEA